MENIFIDQSEQVFSLNIILDDNTDFVGFYCILNEKIIDKKTNCIFYSLINIENFKDKFYKYNSKIFEKVIITPNKLNNYQCFLSNDNNYLANNGNYKVFFNRINNYNFDKKLI